MASSIYGESRQYQVDEMFMLLESLDQKAVDEVRKLILDDINSSGSKESWLLSTLVEHYLATKSKQVQDLFPDIADSQCKHLLERLNDGIRGTGNKLALLQLLLYIVCKQPYWTHRVVEMPVFNTLIKCLKTETDVPVLMTAVMIITVLLPVVPIKINPHLTEILDIFSRLASFCVRKPANTPDIFLLHLHVALYSLFHRLYGMYPYCLLNYIQHQFTKKDLIPVFDEILKPMLERVRLHPQLISGSKDSETSMSRWKHLETQDIVIECAKLSLDMIEGTWDDAPCPAFIRRYQAIQEAVRSRNNSGSTSQELYQSVMNQDTGVIFTALTSDPGVVCSPSVVIGLSTPPQSQRTTPATSFIDNNALVPSVAGTISNTPMMTPQDITPRETPNITYPVDEQSGKNSSRGQAKSTDSRRQSRGTTSMMEAKTTPSGQFSGTSCLTSPLKTEFTQEPPKGAVKTQPRNAIRELEFDIDRQSADIHKRPLSTQNSLERKVEGQNDISGDKCTSVTMNTLINVVDELSTNENECIDDEVSHLTQEENLDGSLESMTCPEAQQVTAESVKQFMKKVNRIRFNSLNNPERHAINDGKRYVRSTSCPPFEEEGSQDNPGNEEASSSNSTGGEEKVVSGVDSTVTLVEKQDNMTRLRLEKSRRSRHHSGNNVEKMSELLEQMSNIPPFSILSQALFTPTKVQICSACQSKLVVGSKTINTEDIKDEIPLFSTFSPPELLDRQLKIGGDLHAKELNKIPLTSKESVNWTHFGGVPPADEVNILKGQILLLHNQVMYERQKRELHAKRNRRLLRKITQTKTLEEQNRAMAEQRKIHEQEIQNLTVSLRLVQEENQAYKQEKESNNYEDLVKLRTTLQTNKDLEEANIGLKNLLITQREDHDKLKMQWQTANSKLSSTVKELDILKEQVVHNQKLKEQVFKLQKEVLLMGELQQKYHERLHSQRNSSSVKPEQNYLAQSLKAEKRVLKESLNGAVQKSEKLSLRIGQLEEQIMTKEKALEDLKGNLEKTKVSHADEVRAVNEKYEAMVRVNQQFEAELLNLQSQVDVLTQKCLLRKRGSTSDGCPTTSKSDWTSVPGEDNSHKSDSESIKTVKLADKSYCDHKQVVDRNCSEVDFSEQRPQSHSAQALDSLSLSSQDGASVTHGGSKSSITYTDSEDNRSSHSNVTTDSGWWEKSTVSK